MNIPNVEKGVANRNQNNWWVPVIRFNVLPN